MSPYMRAYEAGIKLAQIEWMNKVAEGERVYNDPDDGGDMSVLEDMPEESGVASGDLEGSPASAGGDNYYDMLRDIDRDYLGGMGSRAYDSISDYFSGGSAQAAPQQGFAPDQTYQAPGAGQFAGMTEEQGRPPLMSVAQAAPQQGFAPDQTYQAPGAGQYGGIEEEGRGNEPRFDYQAVGQDGMASDNARFTVQSGNYRKQFNRFRDQFGGDGDDAFQGLTYKDFAGALDNRGLVVDDSLDANQIMGRLQNIRRNRFNEQQGIDNPAGPVARGTFGDQLEIQNRRGNLTNRGSLPSMLSAKQNQAQANVNPFGGLRGAGAQRPAPAPKSSYTPTPSSPAPSRPAPSRPAPSRPAPTNLASNNPAQRFGTFRSTDGKGGTTVTTLNGMTQAEGKKQMSDMRASSSQPLGSRFNSAFKDLD